MCAVRKRALLAYDQLQMEPGGPGIPPIVCGAFDRVVIGNGHYIEGPPFRHARERVERNMAIGGVNGVAMKFCPQNSAHESDHASAAAAPFRRAAARIVARDDASTSASAIGDGPPVRTASTNARSSAA